MSDPVRMGNCGDAMKITLGTIWVEVNPDGIPVIVGMYNCTIEPSETMDQIRKQVFETTNYPPRLGQAEQIEEGTFPLV